MQIKVLSHITHIIVIYRPLSSSVNNATTELFIDEFGTLLETYSIKPGALLIAGDFNFHMDNLSEVAAKNFLVLIESFNLHQHVKQTTHRAGHILDLVLTRCGEDIIRSTIIHDSAISDHYTIRCDLNFKKPCLERKGFSYRNGKAINTDLFKEDIAQSPLTFDPPDDVTQ